MVPVIESSPRIPPSKEVAGKLSNLYDRPFGPLGGARGPHYGGHGVQRSFTPRSARAAVTTWWDEPIAKPAPQNGPGSTLDVPDHARSMRFQHRVRQPAMEYQAAVLEERMVLGAFKRRRNELVDSPVNPARTPLSSRGSMSSREKNVWPPERPDPWGVAVEDHNLELRAQHQESMRDFSQSNTAVQQWLLDKKTDMSKQTGQGRDQMDRVMFFLATGREAVQKAGGGEAKLADIKDALENQKSRRRIDPRWSKKIEDSHKDLQWISKCRQKNRSRQREKVDGQRTSSPRSSHSGSTGGLARSWSSGTALPRVSSTQSVKPSSIEPDSLSQNLGVSIKIDPGKGAADRLDGIASPALKQDKSVASDGDEGAQGGLGLQTHAAPSYMAANESWRRRNDGFCRGRAIREQLASR